MKEKDIEQYLRSQAKEHGCLVYKFASPSQRGVPDDIIVWPNGDLHFAELKTLTGELSVLQRYQMFKLTTAGQACFVIRGTEGVDAYFDLRLDPWQPAPTETDWAEDEL